MRAGGGFADALQDFVGCRNVGQGVADPAPTLAAVGIYKQCGIESDVLTLHTCAGVDQTIGVNHVGTRIAQNGELAVQNLFPDIKGVLPVVYADGGHPRVEGCEFLAVLRELAQLSGAVRSPVSAIKDQQHALSAQRAEAKVAAMLVLEDEVGRGLAWGGADLRFGQHLGERERRDKQETETWEATPGSSHGRRLYSR